MNFKKSLLAIALAALMLTGCGISEVTGPQVTTEPGWKSYPQMYDEDMLLSKEAIENTHNVKFLGVYYDLDGCFLFWVQDLSKDLCESHIICEGSTNVVTLESCGAGYELYLETCKDVGNCT